MYRSNLKNTSYLSQCPGPPYSELLEIDGGYLFVIGPSSSEGLGVGLLPQDLPDLVLAPSKKSKPPTPIPEPLDVEADADELCKRLKAIVRECGGSVAVTMNGLHRVRGMPEWFCDWARGQLMDGEAIREAHSLPVRRPLFH